MDNPWLRALAFVKRLPGHARPWRSPRHSFTYESLLRSELYSAKQMAEHGTWLASQHRLSQLPADDSLLDRLADNERMLSTCCTSLAGALPSSRPALPAAQWLLDNFYLVETHIRIAKRHLPTDYSLQLPRLDNGPSAGLPRVYDIALETISHGDGRVDAESLSLFVEAYQQVGTLTLGELWAIPIMLRLALIENLRRVAARVMANWADRDLANAWADQLGETAERDAKSVVLVVADMARSEPPMTPAFVAELARRLQGHSTLLTQPLAWVEQMLSESALSIERNVQLDAQQQAIDQVSISNSIGSLRLLSTIDWKLFVENLSHVEQILRQDPASVYPAMDFASRDHYRHVVEQVARHSAFNEKEVAQAAIELAQAAAPRPGDQAEHVGFYLAGGGLPSLERRLAARIPLAERWQRLLHRAPLVFYLVPVILLSCLLAWGFIRSIDVEGWPTWVLTVMALPIVLTTSRLAIGLVNWLVTLTVKPSFLPRLDYSSGIPADARTLVVVPTMLATASDAEELVEGLEVRFLANRDEHLHFALLSDFMDAPEQTCPEDMALLDLASEGIRALNHKYPSPGCERFFLLHRPRAWNGTEQCWMGRERKRGKLAELNALLRGHGDGCFMRIVGDLQKLERVRYVITLDTDTQLPRGVAQKLVGAMQHPLNRARFDAQTGRVRSGYAILQPRVGISLPSVSRSTYARLFGSEAGVDPYTQAVSDVYQDLFLSGSFIGKGIYAVDAFEQALDGRFADNRVLSHDLIEGCYAHSGLLSDVQLFEAYPARYSVDIKRRHRWIRGDWQLLPWLVPWLRTGTHGLAQSPLSALSRWKILDNLRRSLEPAALLTMLLWGWLASASALPWTLALLGLLLTRPLLDSLLEVLRKTTDVPFSEHLLAALRTSGTFFVRAGLSLAWLPFETNYSLDAILRTLWRLVVSKHRLLQWNPSREEERTSADTLQAVYREQWMQPALVLVLASVLSMQPRVLLLASPILALWLLGPALAWWLSRPRGQVTFTPLAEDLRFLHRLARSNWAFFDRHVGPEDNWLPPDNLQEPPFASIAHRTSPTNMGMALLSHLAAHDFGYLSAGRLFERLAHILDSMSRLERYRGHFYNWYDTQTLKPLSPQYVSAVDSGNLAALLLTLRPGLLEMADTPMLDQRLTLGLLDTFDTLLDAFSRSGRDAREIEALREQVQQAHERSGNLPVTQMSLLAEQLPGLIPPSPGAEETDDCVFWLQALHTQCLDLCTELQGFQLPPGNNLAPQTPLSWRQLAELDPGQWPLSEQLAVTNVRALARQRIAQAQALARRITTLATMDFTFLYDTHRDLFAIGYNADEHRLDSAFYDLLASEMRLTNFVIIAQGQVPQDSWFALGRLLTSNAGVPVLLSWSGSMFEYLMPLLVMPSYEGTLLDQTCQAAVDRQIKHGNLLGIPWGVSESAYNALDAHFNYQYRAFGVPGLGLKRGLGEEHVVAPYASALALMVAPTAACHNLQRLGRLGLAGRFGLYEAVDYSETRLPPGQDSVVIRSFMAHHQGMSFLALTSLLLGKPMQRRFASDPQFQASMLLLQERVPKTAAPYLHSLQASAVVAADCTAETRLRLFSEPNRQHPAVQLLSNGHYHVMVNHVGSGYSRRNDLAVTRWREDASHDDLGNFCYLRDVASGAYWSNTYQPTHHRTRNQEAIFSDGRAEFRIRERNFDCHTEIAVSPEDDIELRRLHLTNHGDERRILELTSYAEVVLAPALSDALHPAFSKLFIQTELIQPLQAILCTRRPRSLQDAVPWMCHVLAVHGADIDAVSYETDRARFIGRGRTLVAPAALDYDTETLSGSAGAVLDPIVAIRCRITLTPGQTVTVDLVTGVADSRDACLQQVAKYRDRHLADRAFDLAWPHSQVLLRQLNGSVADARLFEQMAASVIYPNAGLRASGALLASNGRNQSGLWSQGLSGDLPIVLVQIGDLANLQLVKQMVLAHAYWRQKGLTLDLVIWNEDQAGYRQQLQELIMGIVASGSEAALLDRPGGIFVRPAQQLSEEDRILTLSVARLVLNDSHGTLAEQLHRRRQPPVPPAFQPNPAYTRPEPANHLPTGQLALMLANSYGGFSADGREYVIPLIPDKPPPAPWVNILANPRFGSVVSEAGSAYTWYENAHEYRLTPWHNDPVTDPSGETLYLRDEDSGHYWSPTPQPCPGPGRYCTRHGFGYSVFEYTEDDLRSELWVHVALDAPVKFSRLKLHNHSRRVRRLSVTCFAEWVLGDLRSKSAMHVVSETDPVSGALFARNTYAVEFCGHVAFLDCDLPFDSITCDRSEFLGRNGDSQAPAGMRQARLSGRTGGGLDPCAALRVSVLLEAGESREVVFRLGAEQDAKTATRCVQQYRGLRAAMEAFEKVQIYWRQTLGALRIETPEPSLDVLANGWLMYQVIACRFWARSGFYQSGGAIGFRDQLQDSMAMLHAAPAAAREHLLACAAHQYVEGDVQHWWHPPMQRGVRTRCSDDLLWLPLATSRYVEITGDKAVLDEPVGYLEGRELNVGEESYYDLPAHSHLVESLYQHCQRALGHALQCGVHGLPLIGSGDWNDGMNRIGEQGRGESVWLGFFGHEVLRAFGDLALRHGDTGFAVHCTRQAAVLAENLEQHAWDGGWYRRAWFDDGQALGSASNQECRIDSLAQSWAVLSGVASAERARAAMGALDHHLVRRDIGIVKLLDPPFDQGDLDPGYIKGYLPGVRENGGQYTHAAIWASMAYAHLGDADRAWELLRLINPIRQGCSALIDTYKVEPYVMAADVYAITPHAGRGGWSWYTGSAGWMYRLITESLLGLQRSGDTLRLRPLLPAGWPGCVLHYRYGNTYYRIEVRNSASAERTLRLDGQLLAHATLQLKDDGKLHQVIAQCQSCLLPTN
ncbi:cyclic beta 1-2 glucan synthetase [Pseudomonas monteilii]|uniref:GH36-type glycosyl hydrolase domain-containing protein n=2 Tax=Pseudomonas TaxID=286 RepID=UPI0004894635|nr:MULTISPECIES: glucoamylase family protein [Pseudomonas]MBH3454456.1 cyclic beta 1-2 glucan synthetase [Pseudomonas monteilii]PXX64709.1 cellobiose phosphorylase [Pseudomonas sp. LAIL14HWK12:I1]SOC98273.1 Cellobiose phosphorylase [Pseudomonas sp. LAIL14HWK12:I3]